MIGKDTMDWDVMHAIVEERAYQNDKWGRQTHPPHRWLTILMEEVGEVARAVYEDRIDDQTREGYYAELAQVAAVAAAAMEDLRRQQLRAELVRAPVAPLPDGE